VATLVYLWETKRGFWRIGFQPIVFGKISAAGLTL
jgi:hypothetical protein